MRIKFLFACLLFSNLANADWITPEVLWQLGRVSDPQLSPDGSKVLYNIRRYDVAKNKGNSDIWIYDFSSHSVSPLANDSVSNETMPRWSNDGKKIFYLNDAGSSQIYSMNADGTGKTKISAVEGDINLYGISADNKTIWFVKDVHLDNFLGPDRYPDLPKATGRVYDDLMMRHWDSWADGTYSHVFVSSLKNGEMKDKAVDLLDGQRYDTPLKPEGGDEEIAVSADGKFIAYTCKKMSNRDYALTTNSEIYLYEVATGKTSNLSEGNQGYDKAPVFSPDGKSIAWIQWIEPNNEAAMQRLVIYDLATKTKKELTTNFDYNVEQIKFNAKGSRIYWISDIAATDQICYYDLKSSAVNPIKVLTADTADYNGYSLASLPDGNDKIVGSMMSISLPTELFEVSAVNGKSTQLTFTNREVLQPYTLARVEKRMIKATDGKDILTWIIYPPNFNPNNKYPTLLYCQGGPQTTVSQFFSYRWNFQLMAANQYIIVAPNRRGLPGFGREWNDEISTDWGGQCMRDYLSAIDSMAKEPFVNKERLGAVGASFGGYSIFWLESHHQRRFKAFIAHCGVFNFESMAATEELFFQNHEYDGAYWRKPTPKSYTDFSPHRFAGDWDTPILIIANERDYRVPYTQGLEAYSLARQKNIPARFVSFPDEGHWVLKPQNSIMWQREFFAWLDKYLKN